MKNLDPVAKNARLTNSLFGYTGEAHDIEARLVYLRARYYEPGTMQFLQQDTVLGHIQDPLSRNLYAYGQGNPVKYVDPSGHMVDHGGGSGSAASINPAAESMKGNTVSPQEKYNPITGEHINSINVVKFGDDNERVGPIQAMLNALMTSKYNAGKIDGKFGEKTLKAVNNFKNDNGLYNVGIWKGVVDSKTRSELVTASTQMFEDGSRVFSDAGKDTNPVNSPPVENKGTNNWYNSILQGGVNLIKNPIETIFAIGGITLGTVGLVGSGIGEYFTAGTASPVAIPIAVFSTNTMISSSADLKSIYSGDLEGVGKFNPLKIVAKATFRGVAGIIETPLHHIGKTIEIADDAEELGGYVYEGADLYFGARGVAQGTNIIVDKSYRIVQQTIFAGNISSTVYNVTGVKKVGATVDIGYTLWGWLKKLKGLNVLGGN